MQSNSSLQWRTCQTRRVTAACSERQSAPCGKTCIGTGSALPSLFLPRPWPTTYPILAMILDPTPCTFQHTQTTSTQATVTICRALNLKTNLKIVIPRSSENILRFILSFIKFWRYSNEVHARDDSAIFVNKCLIGQACLWLVKYASDWSSMPLIRSRHMALDKCVLIDWRWQDMEKW